MADPFTLTPQPLRLTTTGTQPLDQALEVTDYDHISALLGVLSIEGGSPSATLRIITGMQKDTEDGWVDLITFTAVSASNTFEVKHSSNEMLRYIRWELVTLSGSGPAVVFAINGMLRSN